jgi:hypothetical protein
MNRRIPLITAVAVCIGGVVGFGTGYHHSSTASFSDLPPPGMPFAPTTAGISTSWFCPGVAATPGRGGDIVITNPGPSPVRGRVTVYSTSSAPVELPVQIDSRDTASFALDKASSGDYLSALVEIDGGLGYVEQRSRHPAGQSTIPCSNAPSSDWYLADGLTLDAGYDLVVTNPFPDYTNVTVTAITADGARTPAKLQNQTIAGQSVMKIDVEQYGLQNEQLVAFEVHSQPERVIVGRAQNYTGGLNRNGYSMTLGAPSTDTHWIFVDGEKGTGIGESITLLNPSASPASVSVQVFTSQAGGTSFNNTQQYDVGEGAVLKIDVNGIDGMPPGRHTVIVDSGTVGIVAEQVITRGGATVVTEGSRVTSRRWWIPTPLRAAATGALVVSNQTGTSGTVSVKALGPGGLIPLAGLQNIALPASNNFLGGTIDLDLAEAEAVGLPLVVDSTVDVVVLRRLPRGGSLKGRTAALALPE